MNLGPFKVGDQPANPIQIDLDSDDDLSAYTSARAELINGSGVTVATLGPVSIVGADLLVTFPFPTAPFATAGLYRLNITLTGGTKSLQLDEVEIVVEARTGWHSLASARAEWADAPSSDATLWRLLDVAHDQCVTYAPTRSGAIPTAWKVAQLMQCRSLYMAGRTTKNEFGGEYVMRIVPLDGQVKQLLRPRTGKLVMW